MRLLIGMIPLLACGCSTAPLAGLMDWCHPSRGGAPIGPLPPVPPAAQAPVPTTAPPGVFDPTRLRRNNPTPPATPAPRTQTVPPQPPPISSGPANSPSDPVLLPPPAFPEGR
ncbi:MAG: hypothetical protein LC104_20665 [Bacteroidales bacterium]|nr:hypothetical protein [Bacteroidales bacterium]